MPNDPQEGRVTIDGQECFLYNKECSSKLQEEFSNEKTTIVCLPNGFIVQTIKNGDSFRYEQSNFDGYFKRQVYQFDVIGMTLKNIANLKTQRWAFELG